MMFTQYPIGLTEQCNEISIITVDATELGHAMYFMIKKLNNIWPLS